MRFPGSAVTGLKALNATVNRTFASHVHELNERFKQAGMQLHYHSGFIQITQDDHIQKQIEQPFWDLVADPLWRNVSIDMADAIDRRDTGGRDPSFYAAKALESAIKIVGTTKDWETGSERGVSD